MDYFVLQNGVVCTVDASAEFFCRVFALENWTLFHQPLYPTGIFSRGSDE